jgi:hypothetical protein
MRNRQHIRVLGGFNKAACGCLPFLGLLLGLWKRADIRRRVSQRDQPAAIWQIDPIIEWR